MNVTSVIKNIIKEEIKKLMNKKYVPSGNSITEGRFKSIREQIAAIVMEYMESDPEVRNWATFATSVYEKGFDKVGNEKKEAGSKEEKLLKKLYKALINKGNKDIEDRDTLKKYQNAVKYFYHFRKKKLGLDYDKSLVKFG